MKYIRNFSTISEATSANDLVSPNLSMINTDSGNKLLAIDSGIKDSKLQIKLDDSGEPIIKKTYSVVLDASGNGAVTGSGTYSEGTSITITATASKGYQFDKWSDNNTNVTRTITVDCDKNLTAIFEDEQWDGLSWYFENYPPAMIAGIKYFSFISNNQSFSYIDSTDEDFSRVYSNKRVYKCNYVNLYNT